MRGPLLPSLGVVLLAACQQPDTSCPPGSSWDPVNEWCVLDDHGQGDSGLDEGGGSGGDEGSGDSGDGGDDTGEAVEWLEVSGDCTAPDDLGSDPLSMTSELRYVQTSMEARLTELVDVTIDHEAGILHGTGQGGLFVWDRSDPAAPTELLLHPNEGHDRYHKAARHGETWYLTHRDDGIFTKQPDDVLGLATVAELRDEGFSDLELEGDVLFASTHGGELQAFDVSGGGPVTEEALIGQETLFESAWDLTIEDGLAYIADAYESFVIVDVSDPTAMTRVGSLDLGLGAQDVALGEGVAYLAVGGAGIATVDLTDPENPALLGFVDYGASVQSVARDGDLLWAVNQESVLVLDISEPTSPVPLASQQTEQWAMHVDAADGYAYVGDWNLMSTWTVDTTVRAPDADLNPSEVFVREEGEIFEVELSNRGSEPLELLGMSVEQEGFTILADRLEVAPGETARVQVTWVGGEAVETELCVATNDPGAPVQAVELHSGSGGNHEAIGEPAIDFTLMGTDDQFHTLSEQLGHPVVLVYFATW